MVPKRNRRNRVYDKVSERFELMTLQSHELMKERMSECEICAAPLIHFVCMIEVQFHNYTSCPALPVFEELVNFKA